MKTIYKHNDIDELTEMYSIVLDLIPGFDHYNIDLLKYCPTNDIARWPIEQVMRLRRRIYLSKLVQS